MKKIIFVLVILGLIYAGRLFAQTPPHPNDGSDPNSGNTPVGGSAPIAGGLFILLNLAAGYTAKKIYVMRQKGKELT